MPKNKPEDLSTTLRTIEEFRYTAPYILVRTKNGDYRIKQSYLSSNREKNEYFLILEIDDREKFY